MSGFKRYQSRVFWGRMESQDLAAEFPAMQQLAIAGEPEEVLDAVDRESDSTDQENTTVIHLERRESSLLVRSLEQASTTRKTPSAELTLAERSFSPASRGQRSQDSGFSDSGRSDSSTASGPRSPRRRRRRRSSRRRDGPAHTSTPKQDPRQPASRTHQLDLSCHGRPEVQAEDQSGRRNSSSGETLGDFLFASEAPEIADPSADERYLLQSVRKPRAPVFLPDVRAPVTAWLEEVRLDVEDECMATLQSKSLPRRKHTDDEPESRDLRLLTASATTAAKKVVDAADRFEQRYQQLIRLIGDSKSSRVERELIQSIESEAAEILLKFGSAPSRRIAYQENQRNIAVELGRLKHNVDRALDNRLDYYIEKVVRGLEEAPREGGSAARGALAALTALGLAGPKAAASVARCSGVRALLTSLVSAGRLTSGLRCACLRALASVCCCLEALDRFVAEGGPDILADVLGAETAPQPERSEAAALLVQVTSPWMDRAGLPYVEPFAPRLVEALAKLAEETSCQQTLLLAAAALNHLSFSRRCIGPIVHSDAIKRLLRCVKKSNGGSVWVMEQVASLIGQVARLPEARKHLAVTRASVALVCFLRMRPPGHEAEYRRLEATTKDALTRLCVDPEIAKQVVAVGGSDCLPMAECSGRVCSSSQPNDTAFRTTKSLRVARKIAAEQIDIARISDSSPR